MRSANARRDSSVRRLKFHRYVPSFNRLTIAPNARCFSGSFARNSRESSYSSHTANTFADDFTDEFALSTR